MKPTHLLAPALIVSTLFSAQAYSSETNVEFTFATPPITKAVAAGEQSHRFTGTYFKVDLDDPLTGYGINFTSRTGNDRGTMGKSKSWGILSLSNESDAAPMDGLSFNWNGNLELYPGGSGDTVIFAGVPLNLMYFTVDTGGNDDTTLAILTYGLQAGIQQHIYLSEMVALTPYVTYAKNQGKSKMKVGDNSSDFDFDSATLTFGFDLTFSGGLSLASMLSTGDDKVTMIQLGWNY